jgi:hypothetical protein
MTSESYGSEENATASCCEHLNNEISDSSSDSEAEDVELQGCEDTEFAELSAAKRAFELPNIAQPGKQYRKTYHKFGCVLLLYTAGNIKYTSGCCVRLQSS